METEEPAVGPEAVTFSPAWFHHPYGVDYTEAAWRDPVTRAERGRELARLIFERTPDETVRALRTANERILG